MVSWQQRRQGAGEVIERTDMICGRPHQGRPHCLERAVRTLRSLGFFGKRGCADFFEWGLSVYEKWVV